MFHFRNFFPPSSDELLTSWIARLADANMYTNSEFIVTVSDKLRLEFNKEKQRS